MTKKLSKKPENVRRRDRRAELKKIFADADYWRGIAARAGWHVVGFSGRYSVLFGKGNLSCNLEGGEIAMLKALHPETWHD